MQRPPQLVLDVRASPNVLVLDDELTRTDPDDEGLLELQRGKGSVAGGNGIHAQRAVGRVCVELVHGSCEQLEEIGRLTPDDGCLVVAPPRSLVHLVGQIRHSQYQTGAHRMVS